MSMASQPAPAHRRQLRFALMEPLRIRNFLLFWIGETVSRFGDEFQAIALATVAIALTGQASTLATVLMVQNIPYVLLLLFGGVITDRFGAKRVMVSTNVLLGLAATWLVLVAARGQVGVGHLYVYAVLVGVIRPFFAPASFSMPPALVARNQLPAANSLHRTGLDVSRLAAAPLAGALVAGWGVAPAFAFNAATFFQAAALQAFIRLPAPERQKPGSAGGWRQLVAGLQGVREDAVLTGAMVFTALWYLGFMGSFHVGIAGLAQITLQAGPKGQGILLAAFGAGNLLGTLAAGNIRNFGRVGRLLVLLGMIYPACFAVAGLASSLALCVPLLIVAGAVNAFIYVAMVVLVQSRSAPAVRGRVMSVLMLCSMGVYPFSYALAGLAAGLWGPRGVMLGLGGLLPVVAVVVAYSIPEFRSYRIDVR